MKSLIGFACIVKIKGNRANFNAFKSVMQNERNNHIIGKQIIKENFYVKAYSMQLEAYLENKKWKEDQTRHIL